MPLGGGDGRGAERERQQDENSAAQLVADATSLAVRAHVGSYETAGEWQMI
jgi:membrane carboxypeptidase/penicillin-binding protein PbpC